MSIETFVRNYFVQDLNAYSLHQIVLMIFSSVSKEIFMTINPLRQKIEIHRFWTVEIFRDWKRYKYTGACTSNAIVHCQNEALNITFSRASRDVPSRQLLHDVWYIMVACTEISFSQSYSILLVHLPQSLST